MRRRLYYVYVIESTDEGRSVFYVGQSAKTPESRLKEQRSCKTYCSTCKCRHYAQGRGMKLRYDLFAQYNPLMTRPEAERVERWLARHLRKRGYRVMGGH